MIGKGWIISTFVFGGVLLAGAVAVPVAYVYNEQHQSLNETSLAAGVLVDENHEVHLGTVDNPLYPGDSRTLDYDVEMMWAGKVNVSVYFDDFQGEGQQYLSVKVTTDNYESPVTTLTNWTKEKPFTFETVMEKQQTFHFTYSLSRDLGSEIDSLSFSFQSHLKVEK
jgi:hypothetical protein